MAVSSPLRHLLAEAVPMAFIDLKAQQDRIERDHSSARSQACSTTVPTSWGRRSTRLRSSSRRSRARSTQSRAPAAPMRLLIAMMAKGIGPGDAVCARPSPTRRRRRRSHCSAPRRCSSTCARIRSTSTWRYSRRDRNGPRAGLTPRAVIAVDLFGQPADYDAIVPLQNARACSCSATARRASAQKPNGRKVGQIGRATATSFFPAKPLGCYGDGGAIFTDDDATGRRDAIDPPARQRVATSTTSSASALMGGSIRSRPRF